MSARYTVASAGRVREHPSGRYLGRVREMYYAWGDTIYLAQDARGNAIRTALIRDIAALAVIRHAYPERRVTLLDLDVKP